MLVEAAFEQDNAKSLTRRTYRFKTSNAWEAKQSENIIDMRIGTNMLTPMGFLTLELGKVAVEGPRKDKPYPGKHYIGISGGGWRALSGHMGAFRSLSENGALPKVHMFSSVSGGTWFLSKLAFDEDFSANVLDNKRPISEIVGEWLESFYFRTLLSSSGLRHNEQNQDGLRGFLTKLVAHAPGPLRDNLGTSITKANQFNFSWQTLVETSVMGHRVADQILNKAKFATKTGAKFRDNCTLAFNWHQMPYWDGSGARWFLKGRQRSDFVQRPVYTSALYKRLNNTIKVEVQSKGQKINALYKICSQKKHTQRILTDDQQRFLNNDGVEAVLALWSAHAGSSVTASILESISFCIFCSSLIAIFYYSNPFDSEQNQMQTALFALVTIVLAYFWFLPHAWMGSYTMMFFAPIVALYYVFRKLCCIAVNTFQWCRENPHIVFNATLFLILPPAFLLGRNYALLSIGVVVIAAAMKQEPLTIPLLLLTLTLLSMMLWVYVRLMYPIGLEEPAFEPAKCDDYAFDFGELTVGQAASASSAAAGFAAVRPWVQSAIELTRAKVKVMAVGGINYFYCQQAELVFRSLIEKCNQDPVVKEFKKLIGCRKLFARPEEAYTTAERWTGFLQKLAVSMKLSTQQGQSVKDYSAFDAVRITENHTRIDAYAHNAIV